jgi:hypothetical protein
MSGWIGVDLDGTLAEYGVGHNINTIGAPVPAMATRVKEWLARGYDVRIVTARVGCTGHYVDLSGRHDDDDFATQQRRLIEDWCEKHLGQRLPVTATKDFAMLALYDDRAIQVEMNTGRIIGTDPLSR